MKLIYRIALRLSLLLVPLIAIWAVVFYFTMVSEINDEADDALEDYSEVLILRLLGGEELPSTGDGTNNSYSVTTVSEEYATSRRAISYHDAEVYIPEKRETEPARVLVTIFPDRNGDWHELRVSMPTFERQDLQGTVLRWVVLLYFVLLAICLGTTLWVFRKSMRPLYALLAWLDAYSPGKAPEPVPNDTDIEEFMRLNTAAQQAVERFEKLLGQQKEFIGNASHELQTPLAVLQGRLEYLVSNGNLSEEMLSEASKMQAALSRIIRLNKALLLLARIENGQFPESTVIDIAVLLREQQELYAEIYADRNISCRLTLPESFLVRMNESLVSVLVTNLLKNAYVHGAEGSMVEVVLADGVLDISGEGGAALDAEHIFERFYQGGKKKEGSTGLGLALVKAVSDSYGMAVEYRYSDCRHHFLLPLGKISV